MAQSGKALCLSYWRECLLSRATLLHRQRFVAGPKGRCAEAHSDPASRPSPYARQVPEWLHWLRQSQKSRGEQLQTAENPRKECRARAASLYRHLRPNSYDNSNGYYYLSSSPNTISRLPIIATV